MSMPDGSPASAPQPEHPPLPLEARLDELAALVTSLEARIASLEGGQVVTSAVATAKADISEVFPAAIPVESLPSPSGLMTLIGRVCLILGGATLIRALVDAGTIRNGWGVALGLAYAITWALLARRARHPLDAAFHALASILIAYPLLVESTTRFGILPPPLAAFLLLTVTLVHGSVAWQRDLKPIAWLATLASLGAGLAMMAARQTIEPFLAVFLVLGLVSLWGTADRKWQGLRWPTALAADLGVLILSSLAAWPGGVPDAYKTITPGGTILLALLLPLAYIGSFAGRMLAQRRRVNTFEIAQTALALLLGFGGALRVALATGSGAGLLGLGISLAGLGCYATAIPFAGYQDETRANFHFFTFLALVFLLVGGPIVLPLPLFATLCGLVGCAALVQALRVERLVLAVQSGIYLAVCAAASGLVRWSFKAFLDPAGPVAPVEAASLAALLFCGATLVLFLLRRPSEFATKLRTLMLALGALVALGCGALVIRGICAATGVGAADAGVLAAVRTGVLSCLILALAALGRKLPVLDVRWLVYPMLGITALKFLFEDIPVGRPLTLFIGFMCFGATLMLAPRLLKASPAKGPVSPEEPL